jgi:hypothetical protein
MMSGNLKQMIGWEGWGAYRLSTASLSGVDQLVGCRVIHENDVPKMSKGPELTNNIEVDAGSRVAET